MKIIILLFTCFFIGCSTSNQHDLEGVYSERGRHGIMVVELKGGKFKYWSKTLPYFAPEYVYEKHSGNYSLDGQFLTLDNQKFFVKRMIFVKLEGKQVLMNKDNYDSWIKSKEVDTWGVLFKTPLKNVTGNYEEVYKTLE